MSMMLAGRRRGAPSDNGGGTPPTLVARMLNVGDWFTQGRGSTTSDTRGLTGRGPLFLPYGAPQGLRLRFEVAPGQLLKARIEGGPSFTWGGATSYTEAGPAGNRVWSDVLNYVVQPGTTPILRTFTINPTGGGLTFQGYDARSTAWNFGDFYSTDGTAGLNVGSGPQAVPQVVQGMAPDTAISFLLVGDSITAGPTGYTEIAARNAGLAGYSVGTGGEAGNTFLASVDSKVEALGYAWFTHVLHQHVVNESRGASWQAIAQARLSCWLWGQDKGLVNFQTTCTPFTDGNNVPVTQFNETNNILGINAWLRDGAPVVAGSLAVLDPGSTGLRAGQQGHPLKGVLDAAAALYQNGQVDRWGNGGVGDGVHPHPAARDVMATALTPMLAALS